MNGTSVANATISIHTLIVGASAAGLACAACLRQQHIEYVLLEQHQQAGHSWRNHYDRLQLHTHKASSHLPFLKFPSAVSKYPSRQAFVTYLEEYVQKLELQPQFGKKVERIQKKDKEWVVTTNRQTYLARYVIIATGYNSQPNLPYIKGLDSFPGLVLHSSAYKNGKAFRQQRVLVVGFGNSACDIALCLLEHGARISMSVRGSINIIPRDILGIPILKIAISQGLLPAKLADALNKPLLNLMIGNLERYGLKQAPYGALEQIEKQQRIPLLDTGIVRQIKAGAIPLYPAISYIKDKTVYFENGVSTSFDAILLATGYKPAFQELLQGQDGYLSEQGKFLISGQEIKESGLFLCGFYISPTGMLREIGREAKQIAKAIQAKSNNA